MKVGLFFPDGAFCHIRKVVSALETIGHECVLGSAEACAAVFAADVTVSAAAADAGRKAGAPVCQQVLDLPQWRFEDPFFKERYASYRRTLEEASRIVAISRATKEALKNLWGLDSYVIGHPVDDEAILAVPDPDERLHQVISVGRFDIRKNFHQIIQALSLVKNPPEFVLVGILHSLDPALYQRLAREYGVKIRLLVSVPDEVKFREMKKSKALIAPSIFEGLGLTPIESILCGTPVVVHDMPVTREVFGGAVAWCDGNDPDSIAAALEPVLTSRGVGAEMVAALRPKMEYFFLARYAERLSRQLECMLGD